MNNNLNQNKFSPIFIVGNSRSGTTLMGSILGLNSDVFTFEELHFFGTLWSPSDRDKQLTIKQAEMLTAKLLAIQDKDVISHQDPQLFIPEAKTLLSQLEAKSYTATDVFQTFLIYIAQKNSKHFPCEQTPRNVLYLTEILDLYPDCHIINMVRDPRDVLLSQKYKWKIRFLGASNIPYREAIRSWSNYHAITISKLWNVSVNAAAKYKNHPQILTIRFEDLITQPEKILRQVCQFTKLEFTPAMLQVSQSEGGVSSHKKIAPGQKGIDNRATGKWKQGGLSSTEIHLCQQITQENMHRHNYTIEPIKVNPLRVILSHLFLPIKLSLAIIFNLQRMKNIVAEIIKRL